VEEVASRQLGMRFADPSSTVIVDAAGVPAGTAPGERR
jgi:hypothetical protein